MDLIDLNRKMEESKMDIQSPYIKSSSSGIDEVRKRIAKRAMTNNLIKTEGEILSFKDTETRPESDDLLKQKIFTIGKKIVGEEIKKFAEIAGREIGKEFNEIEERLNENLKSNTLDLQNNIDKKIEKFNYNIRDLENRIRDLEILSIGTMKKDSQKIEPETQIETEKKEAEKPNILKNLIEEVKKEEIKNTLEEKKVDEKKERGTNKDIQKYYATVEAREEEEKYILNKIKELTSLFEKTGLLFRKNSYTSTLKDLKMEEFLNKKEDEEYKKIDKNDKEKISEILIDFMDTLNIDPADNEKIDEFLKRAYRIEFQEMNSK